MKVMDVAAKGYIDIPGVSAAEAGAGFSIQMWVRPTGKGGQVWYWGEGGPLLVMTANGALELRVGVLKLVAPGAMTAGRWTHVAVEFAADGTAAIFVDGPRAAVGTLPKLTATPSIRLADPGSPGFTLADVRLLARVRTAEERAPGAAPQGPLAHYAGLLEGAAVRDAGPLQRHGQLVGAGQTSESAELDALRSASPGALVWDEKGDHAELPAVTADFTGGIAVEAWVRPRKDRPGMSLLALGGPEHFQVSLEPEKGLVRVDFVAKVGSSRIEVPGAVRGDEWQHLCVSVDGGGMCRVFVDGRVVHEQQAAPLAAAREGGRRGGAIGKDFLGELAELRVWQGGRSLEEVRALRLRRARGDEPQLVLCYHFDTLAEGLAIDAAPRRLHARPRGRLTQGDGEGLPLRALHDARRVHVRAAGKLLLDELPVSLFPNKTIDVGFGIGEIDLKVPTAGEYGTVKGSLVRCAVYEVAIEPRGAGGSKLAGEVEVRVDAPVTVVRSDGGKLRIEAWKPDVTMRVRVSDGGRARVRVLAAKSLDCPTLRIRAAGMDADCWTIVRPADAAQQQLARLSVAALKQPPPGKSPVLKSSMGKDASEAVTQFMRDAAGALPTGAPASIQTGQKVSWNEVWGVVEEAGAAVGSAVVDLGGDVAKLTISAAEDAAKLANKAAGAAVRAGEQAIRSCILDARDLAIDGTKTTWGAVMVVGERVVDGSKQMFRTIVAGALEVAGAIEAFLQRIGAALRDFIEFLAMLFNWDKFLAKSDELYELAKQQFAKVGGYAEQIRDIPALLDELVARPVRSGLSGNSLGRAFGVGGFEMPDFDELKWLVDVIEEAFTGSGPKLADDPKGKQGPTQLDETTTAAEREATTAALPKALLEGRDVLATPMDALLDLPPKMWAAGRSVTTETAGWIADRTADLGGMARSTLTSRLTVPYLTEVIEVAILRGRKLDMLRLIALVGAVPAVLTGGGHKSTGSQQKSTRSQAEEAIRWTQFGISLVNSALFIARSASEWSGDFVSVWTFSAIGGATSVVAAAFDIGAAAAFEDAETRWFGVTHGVLALCGGLWMVGSTAWAISWPEGVAVIAAIDAVVEVVIGSGELATAIVVFAQGELAGDEFWAQIGFRMANWSLRGLYRLLDGVDNSRIQAANALTTSCAVAILACDLTEMGYGLADTAMG
ncbi:LamG domain-containing protein [Nannocystis bainbridge]|uniref:LamG domain-containing protein n=1 Tax=Nannocystis bainbridge TaxID=2995303 RepID=A0ABT5E6G2_9BACT|nr:LamG domain-containing protein [Nannocystis bainbridge]MDC0720513.1 LamG domain-containing protein [Nannocystis bainbridge]